MKGLPAGKPVSTRQSVFRQVRPDFKTAEDVVFLLTIPVCAFLTQNPHSWHHQLPSIVVKGRGNIVKNSIILAIILGSSIGLVSTAGADEVVFNNQELVLPMSDQQFPNMKQLRGIIDHSADNPIIGSLSDKPALSVSQIKRQIHQAQEVALSLEKSESFIDPVVTGQSNRLMVFQKFDSRGLPMSHHQEYDRPNAKSLASSIWEAIDLNPYPGD